MKRNDWIWQSVAVMFTALQWSNPAAWLVAFVNSDRLQKRQLTTKCLATGVAAERSMRPNCFRLASASAGIQWLLHQWRQSVGAVLPVGSGGF